VRVPAPAPAGAGNPGGETPSTGSIAVASACKQPPIALAAGVRRRNDVPNQLSTRERTVAQAVLDYLTSNPDAMDTIEGIANFWLPLRETAVEVRLLQKVLDCLVSDGLLEALNTGDNRQYRLRRTGLGGAYAM
jgi:hypothetical protein